MNIVGKCGSVVLGKWGVVRTTASACWAFIVLAVHPSSWSRAVREQLAKQIVFTGIDAVGVILMIAALTGISVVVQAQLWLGRLGQTEMLGSILVAVVIREIGPLLVNFVVIGRSGTAISTELANMKVRNEVDLLESMGVEPMVYLVLPRVLGVIISVFCLTICFIMISLVSGYIFGYLMGTTAGDPTGFMRTIFRSIKPADIFNLLAKTIIPGLVTGVICTIEGLQVKGLITEVPQATTRAVVRSIMALLVVFAIVSVFTYV